MALGGGSRTELQLARRVSMRASSSTTLGVETAHCRSVVLGRRLAMRLANTPYPPYAADMRKKTDVYIYTFIHPRPLERIVREQDISHSRADTPSLHARPSGLLQAVFMGPSDAAHARFSRALPFHSQHLSNNAQRPHSLKLARSTRPQTRRRNWPHLPLAALSR